MYIYIYFITWKPMSGRTWQGWEQRQLANQVQVWEECSESPCWWPSEQLLQELWQRQRFSASIGEKEPTWSCWAHCPPHYHSLQCDPSSIVILYSQEKKNLNVGTKLEAIISQLTQMWGRRWNIKAVLDGTKLAWSVKAGKKGANFTVWLYRIEERKRERLKFHIYVQRGLLNAGRLGLKWSRWDLAGEHIAVWGWCNAMQCI